jgi:hypothetical protein
VMVARHVSRRMGHGELGAADGPCGALVSCRRGALGAGGQGATGVGCACGEG